MIAVKHEQVLLAASSNMICLRLKHQTREKIQRLTGQHSPPNQVISLSTVQKCARYSSLVVSQRTTAEAPNYELYEIDSMRLYRALPVCVGVKTLPYAT